MPSRSLSIHDAAAGSRRDPLNRPLERSDERQASVAELRARGAVFETYDFGDVFRTVDGIATSAAGEKMAWLKDPEGNLVSIGPH